MEELHRKQRLTGLSEAEAEELTRLEQQYERVILVRSYSDSLLASTGRATVEALHLNRPVLVYARWLWVGWGCHPPEL